MKPGSRQARGYGVEHERERRRLKHHVDAGNAYCVECGGYIQPGTKFHLAHDHSTGELAGASHARCNLAERNRRYARSRRRNLRDWGV